jgi:tetratricopeptide (TPR) repeat protein
LLKHESESPAAVQKKFGIVFRLTRNIVMEIFIRLAGVQLGPYSEEQVRQHLSDGLLSLTDTAKSDHSPDWAPLGDILAGVSSPAASDSPEPEPETPALSFADEEQGSEAPPRAPAPPPGVMHLPFRQPDSGPSDPSQSGGLDKKTILLGPTAPVRPSTLGPSPLSVVTTSPLVPGSQATKKVSRAALVKALASQTSPMPTRGIPAPPGPATTTPGDAPAAQPDSKKAPPSALSKALTAKTVPLRSTPSAPPVPVMLPTTTPLPTRHIFKPATGAVAPLSAAKAAEKTAPMKRPEAAQIPPARSSEMEVATVKLPKPGARGDDPAATAVSNQSIDESAASKPPTAPRKLLPKIIAAWAVLAVFMLYYVWSPYHAAASLRSAMDAGDAAGLDAAIDFPAVRDSLKAQVGDQIARSGIPASKPIFPAGPPADVALSMLNHSVDAYVTPAGIAGLVNKSDTPADGDPAQLISSDVAAKILLAFNTQPVNNEGLASVGDFVIDHGTAMLHLKFTGFGWKLKRVDLGPDLAARGSSRAAAPVLSPVLDTYLERGTAKFQNGDPKGAITDLTQVLSIDPQSSAAYNERGAVRESTGDSDGAIKDFTQALAIDPQMAAAYNGRGNAKSAKNDEDGAIADFNQAVHFDPTLATAYDSRGNAKMAKDDTEGAIADFTQAIAIDPNLASAYSDRGFARQANGNPDGAIADYTQALALKPKTARTYFNRGLARQAQGNLDAAIVDFDHALAFDPKIADAYYYRGNAKSANRDVDGAIADYTQAVALDPKIASAFSNRGLARQAKGDLDGAVADYTQALSLDPKIATAYYNRALIEAQRNDLDGAIADSTQALYLDPKNAQAYCTRGFAKLTKGNLDGALTDLKQFCDLAPRDHDADHARLYLWLISKAQNSGAEADQDLSAALENSWNSTPDDVVTKTANFFLGRMTEADYLAAAPSSDAKADQAQHCLIWYFTGMKRALMGDKNGAIDAFHQCVDTQQKDFCEYVLAQAELRALEPTPPLTPAPPVAEPVAPAPPNGTPKAD